MGLGLGVPKKRGSIGKKNAIRIGQFHKQRGGIFGLDDGKED